MELSSGDDRRPPSISALPPAPCNEPACPPVPLTPIVGRDSELREVVTRLRWDGVRLLTLTGPGGVGKTRLAIRAGDELGSKPGTDPIVAFVSLALVRSPTAVAAAIAQAVGIRGYEERSLIARLRFISDQRELVLILDNFEHVLDAAPLVRELLWGCRRLRVLVTSRVRLGISGEFVFPVAPLALPDSMSLSDPAAARTSPAVRLFLERASAARPGFKLTEANAAHVTAICRRLDGLPLALELAAARIALLTPRELLEQLDPLLPMLTGADDEPERARTMRGAVAWSYDMLSVPEREAFLSLSVFVGGCALAAAEAVAHAGGEHETKPDLLHRIEQLIASSLIQRTDSADGETTRLAMLETIREYGLERAASHGELAAFRQRHARWFQQLAAEVDSHMEQPDLDRWWPLLAADHDNVRAAFDWLESTGQGDDLLEFSANLWRFWFHDGHIAEGSERLNRALQLGKESPSRVRCEVLTGAAMLAHFRGADSDAIAYCREAQASLPDPAGGSLLGRVRYILGLIDEDQARFDSAREHFSSALEAFSRTGNHFWSCAAQTHLGIVALGSGDLETATATLAEVLIAQREAGFGWETARTLLALAQALIASGQTVTVRPYLTEALARAIDQGAPRSLTHDTMSTIALFAAETGASRLAARLSGWAAAERTRTGAVPSFPEHSLFAGAEEKARGHLGGAEFEKEWKQGHALQWTTIADEAAAIVTDGFVDGVPGRSAFSAAPPLTRREIEVLRLLSRRLTDKEIAEELGLSPRTVMHHVSSVLGKLGLSSRREASTWAIKHGIR